ncbi:MAG: Dabb family protein, partial [Gammaproteobacteria bacterium]
RAMIRERYRPGAEARGLRFVEEQVSPPLALADQPNVLWLRWTLPDAAAFWAMRFQSGDPAVAAFWRELDGFVLSRERQFLADAAAELPGPREVTPFRVTPAAWRETAQLTLREGLGEEEIAAFAGTLARAADLPGILRTHLGRNIVVDYGAGHFSWDLVYADRAAADTARRSALWQETLLTALASHCSARAALGLQTVGAGCRLPALGGGIKRTALFRLLPGVDADRQSGWQRDTLEMAAQIPAIRNWRLSRAIALPWDAPAVAPWTWVWEQEYESLDGLTVDYMVHPHHWAFVDRSFDPESGAQIIDTALCHAFCPLERSLIVL